MARPQKNKRLRKEREEKRCLNCNAVLQGRFCHLCGQENIEQREPILTVTLSFIENITFFNSKFFKTLIPFISKPGVLTNEYNSGKRNTYLSPVKMYFFLSFLYFLLSYWTSPSVDVVDYKFSSATQSDSVVTDTVRSAERSTELGVDVPTGIDNWFTRKLAKLREKAEKEGNDSILHKLNKRYIDNIPTVIFLIMPFLALIFKLFYRKRYFIDHLTHSLHIHSFGFFVFILITLLHLLLPKQNELASYISIILLAVYVLKSIKVVYAQKWAISIIKGLVITVLYGVVFGIGFFINILVALAMA